MGEGLSIFVSVLISTWMLSDTRVLLLTDDLLLKTTLITFVCQMCLYYNDLYDWKITIGFQELSIRLLQALGGASIILAFVYLIFPTAVIGKGAFVISVGIGFVLIVSWRFVYTQILNRGLFNQKIVLLGSSVLAGNIYDEILMRKDCGYAVSANISEGEHPNGFTDASTVTIHKKDYRGLCEMVKDMNISKIIVAMEERRGIFPTQELLNCRMEGIEIIDGHSFYEMLTGKLMVELIPPGWLIYSVGFRKSIIQRFFKRLVDILLSTTLLVLFMPLFVLIAVLIKIDSKGAILFSQERIGEKGKKYIIYKFRSMVMDAEKQSGPKWADDDDSRITRIGKLLRRWRLDEIPQIWNVLKGEMSFVGPRPEREYFIHQLEKIIPYYKERLTIKPGVTGWAQVSYGYGATIEDAIEKLNYDLFYIKNMSVWFDLMIILLTVKTVLSAKNVR